MDSQGIVCSLHFGRLPYQRAACYVHLGLLHCLCDAIFELLSGAKTPAAEATPVGISFNIQTPIPQYAQKEKGIPERNRATKFQRASAGSAESIKECKKCFSEHSDVLLGAGCRGFKSLHSDQRKTTPYGTNPRLAARGLSRTGLFSASKPHPLRSRWRLCRLTDAACPLRVVSALQAVGFAARIRWRKVNKFVIARRPKADVAP